MTVVIDASVFSKLYLQEDDSLVAHSFCHWVVESDQVLLVPYLLKQELCMAALPYGIDFTLPLDVLTGYEAVGLQLLDPPRSTWLLAEKICRTGHKKSGYPSLADSLYHALAIEVGGTLVTADTRHLAKTKAFGHAVALADWETLLTA